MGIVKLDPTMPDNPDHYPFAVICAVHADYDPRQAPGIGGQVPVQNGLFITLRAERLDQGVGLSRQRGAGCQMPTALAAEAGLGTLNAEADW